MRKAICWIFISGLIVACNSNPIATVGTGKKDSASIVLEQKERKETRNKLAVDDIVDAFNSQHLVATFKDYSPDIIDYSDGSGPPIKGLDTVRKLSLAFFNSFSNFKSEDVQIAADGDWVMVWAKWSAMWTKDFGGQKATGKTFHVQDADVFRFDGNGKIIEHHSVQPFSTLASQIGMKL
jgi:ketosteroid isomerase-like protein